MKKKAEINSRLEALLSKASEKNLDSVLVSSPSALRALTLVDCGESVLEVSPNRRGSKFSIYTDFRYVSQLHRTLPHIKVRKVRNVSLLKPYGKRVGCEMSVPYGTVLKWQAKTPGLEFVDFSADIQELKAVKTEDEISRLRAAENLTCQIWEEARAKFRPGMTERDMARIIRILMLEKGEGEAFDTIVCVGANAAECHHVPDDTPWNGRDGVLVDMGVKLNGVSSDLTRNILPKRLSRLYRTVYSTVLEANLKAIAAVKPGVTCKALDKVARDVIKKAGFGNAFGHSLGHGVGYEVHDSPSVSKRSAEVLESGMVITIEPGIYLEGNLGVRIEDLVLVTETGCEVLSKTAK